MKTRRREMLVKTSGGGGGHNLPAEYQEVEYITAENDASVWSGFTIPAYRWQNNDEFSFIAKADTVGSNGYATLAHTDITSGIKYVGLKTDGTLALSYFSQSSLTKDAQGFLHGETISTTTANTQIPIFLTFQKAVHQWSSGTITVKNLTIKQNDAIIYELYPCYRKADNVIGMYDITNDVFYTNEGTGTFTKGGNV